MAQCAAARRICPRRASLVAALAAVIVRMGVPATAGMLFTWYCVLGIAAILAVALDGLRTRLAGRPLWNDVQQAARS